MKLFRVNLRNFSSCVNTDYSSFYVVAEDPSKAYRKVRNFLDKNDLMFRSAREMKSIELLADEKHYGETGVMLFL